jgi:O-antigen/teichoic acid export membrane protein
MELGKHLGKGLWGLADKVLPVIYGLGYVLLVIRVLPEEEFGNFVLVQEVFLVISGLSTAFALQPMLKFAAEKDSNFIEIARAGMVLNLLFTLGAALLVTVCSVPLAALFNSPGLRLLLLFVPLMLVASFVRNVALVALQAQFRIREVFLIDAVHFLGAPFLTWVYSRVEVFDSALELVYINIISLSASSLIGLVLARRLIALRGGPLRPVLAQLWDFGKFAIGGAASQMLYTRIDSFVLAAFSGPVAVAIYNAAKIVTRVFEMLNQVVQMFVLPATSRLSNEGKTAWLRSMLEKVLFATIAGMLPVALVLLVGASTIVHILYGQRYQDAAVLLQIFALLSFSTPFLAVAWNALMGLGEAKASFNLGMVMIGVALLLYTLFIPFWGAWGAAIAYVLATASIALLSMAMLHRRVPVSVRGIASRWRDVRSFIVRRVLQATEKD